MGINLVIVFYHHGEAASSDIILTEGVQSTLWRAVSVTEG